MKLLAFIVSLLAGTALYYAYQLRQATQQFVDSEHYQVGETGFSYGAYQADGSAIYWPAILLLLLGLFLARLAWNLWTEKAPGSRQRRPGRPRRKAPEQRRDDL